MYVCVRKRLFLGSNMLYIHFSKKSYMKYDGSLLFLSHIINQYINEERNQAPIVKEGNVWLGL